MAAISNIDTKAAVQKFLARRSVIDKEDQAADPSDEVQAVLEQVALSFLLFPQAALSFVIQAKNTLQQILKSDSDFLTYLIKAVNDISNPNTVVQDTSDLISAQTALIEIANTGVISPSSQSYSKYTQAVNNFLSGPIATSLKRTLNNELNRTGNEAKQDIFRVLVAYISIHQSMISALAVLANSVTNFNSVNLSSVVASKTIARVRTSLQKVINGIQKQVVSNTSVAIELMSGAASLQSISGKRGIYDPTISTGSFPSNLTVYGSSEPAQAVTTGNQAVTDLSLITPPWVFTVTVDPLLDGGTTYNQDLPNTAATGNVWVVSNRDDNTLPFVVPVDNKTLYVQLDGPAPLSYEPVLVIAVTLPTGSQSFSTLVSTINTALSPHAFCVEFAPGSRRFLIYGDGTVTGITIRTTNPGVFDPITGVYTPAPADADEILGFSADQHSNSLGQFNPSDLMDILQANINTASFSIADGVPTVISNLAGQESSLLFADLAANFGFPTTLVTSSPGYVNLVDNNGNVLAPADLGVVLGSLIDMPDFADPSRSLLSVVTAIDGNNLLFDPGVTLARATKAFVAVTAPIVSAAMLIVSSCTRYIGFFDKDVTNIQRVLNPLLTSPSPTLAQIDDALSELSSILGSVTALLSSLSNIVVNIDQAKYASIASNIVSSLEERGLDRAVTLLGQGSFSNFFSLTQENASNSSQFMKTIETVGRTDFASTTVESRMSDLSPSGTTPDKKILPDESLNKGEESVV